MRFGNPYRCCGSGVRDLLRFWRLPNSQQRKKDGSGSIFAPNMFSWKCHDLAVAGTVTAVKRATLVLLPSYVNPRVRTSLSRSMLIPPTPRALLIGAQRGTSTPKFWAQRNKSTLQIFLVTQ